MTIYSKQVGGYAGVFRINGRGPWRTFQCSRCWLLAYGDEPHQRIPFTQAGANALRRVSTRGLPYDFRCNGAEGHRAFDAYAARKRTP